MLINYLWIFCFFAGCLTVLYLFLAKNYTQAAIRIKLTSFRNPVKAKSGQKMSDILSLFLRPLKNRLLQLTPQNLKKKLENTIDSSGIQWEVEDLLLLKVILAVIFTILFLALSRLSNNSLTPLLLLIFTLGGFVLPDALLYRRTKRRRHEIKHALPPFIDYLTISVEAGLGLDLALARVIKEIQGPLAEEIAYTLTEIKYGKTKQEAFRKLAHRINIPEFTTFIMAIINAEQFGVSLSSIMHIQSQQLREKRKQSMQEQAYKIPVKLVFPLILFILPGLFIVLLGPAAIQVFKTLF